MVPLESALAEQPLRLTGGGADAALDGDGRREDAVTTLLGEPLLPTAWGGAAAAAQDGDERSEDTAARVRSRGSANSQSLLSPSIAGSREAKMSKCNQIQIVRAQ